MIEVRRLRWKTVNGAAKDAQGRADPVALNRAGTLGDNGWRGAWHVFASGGRAICKRSVFSAYRVREQGTLKDIQKGDRVCRDCADLHPALGALTVIGRQPNQDRGRAMTNQPLAVPRTPYYEDELVSIWHVDSIAYLPFIPDDSYDIVLTDPPYNEVNRTGAKNRDGSEWYGMDKGGADSLEVRVTDLAIEFARISKMWAYVFCGWKQVSEFLRVFEHEGMSIRMGGWHKASPVPVAASMNWLNTFETCAIGRHPKASFVGFTEDPIWYGEKEHRTIHPTQKPSWLLLKILAASVGGTDATVLDPFMGSGSTLESAKKLGLKAVGYEINEEYCERAANRLSQDTLF